MLKDFDQENKVNKVKKSNHFIYFFILSFFSFFFLFTSSTFAATYYWVGNSDNTGLTSAKANWDTRAGQACSGAGNASAAPVAADSLNFVSNCTSNATIDATFSVTNITIASGYTGTITTNTGININVSGNFTKSDGTWTSAGSVTFNGVNNSQTIAGDLSSGRVIITKTQSANITIATSTTINLGNNATSQLTTASLYIGNLINNGTILVGTGTWTVNNGTGIGTITNNGTITHSGSGWDINYTNLINNGTINYTGWINLEASFTQSGTFNFTGITLTLDGCVTTPTINAGNISVGIVIINKTCTNVITIATSTTINLGNNATSTLTSGSNYYTNLINNGTILVGTGTWTVNNGTGIGTITNNGTITHSGSGWDINYTNLINNGTINYTGWINLEASFTQNGTFNFTGITLTLDGYTTTPTINAGNISAGIVIINKTRTNVITIATSTTINLGNNATSTLTSGSNYYTNLINNGTILVGTGTWTVNNGTGFGTITNNGTITHSGSGWDINYTNLINNGTINYTGWINLEASFTQNGTFNFTGITLTLDGYTTTPTINAGNISAGIVIINKTRTNVITIATSTTINLGNNATSTLSTASGYYTNLINNGTILVGTGTWTVNNGTDVGTITNNGTITHSGSGWNINYTNLTNNGTINYSGTTLSIANNLTNSNIINFATSTAVSVTSNITNSGTITGGLTLTNQGNLTQSGSGTSSFSTTTFSGINNQTITVNGELGGKVVINKISNGCSGVWTTISTSTTINLGNNPVSNLSNAAYCGQANGIINNGTIIVDSGTWTLSGVSEGGDRLTNNGNIIHNGSNWIFSGEPVSFINNGTVTYSGNTISMEGSFTQSGTFDLVGKTVQFNGHKSSTITAGNSLASSTVIINKISDFCNSISITINSGTTINLGNSPTSTLSTSTYCGPTNGIINNGSIIILSGTWTINGVSVSGDYITNNGIITHNGNGWVIAGAPINFTNTGTINYAGAAISIAGNFIQNGTFDLNGKTVTFNGATNTSLTTTSTTTGYSIILNKTNGNTLTLNNNIVVNNATTTSGTLTNPATAKTITVTGNLSIADASKFGGTNLSLVLSGVNNQTIGVSGTLLTSLEINKLLGKAILNTNVTTNTGKACTITYGTFFLNGKTLTCAGGLNVSANGILELIGSETFTTPTLATGSTVKYVGDGDGGADTYYIKNDAIYSNLEIAGVDALDRFKFFALNSDDLLAYWKGNGNALDSSVNGYHGAFVNSATTTTGYTGLGQAFSLNGVSDRISIAGAVSSQGNKSFSCWFKSNNISANQTIFFRGYNTNTDYLSVGLSSSIIFASGDNEAIDSKTSPILNSNQWYHLVVLKSAGKVDKVYINGVDVTVQPGTGNWVDASNTTSIGIYITSYPFNGLIDDVRLYNRTLSSGEITAIYNYNGVSESIPLTLTDSLTHTSGLLDMSNVDLTLNGTDQTLSLATTTTINSLTKIASSTPSTLLFANTAESPLIITGTTTLQATSTGSLTLGSTVEGTPWYFSPNGARDFTNFTVSDSNNVSSTTIETNGLSITDGDRNINWTFGGNTTVFLGNNSIQYEHITLPQAGDSELGGAFHLTVLNGATNLEAITFNYTGTISTSSISDINLYTHTLSSTTDLCPQAMPATSTLYATVDSIATSTMTFTNTLSLNANTKNCLYFTYDLDIPAYDISLLGRDIDIDMVNPHTNIQISAGNNTTIKNRTTIVGRSVIIDPNITFISFQVPDPTKNPTLYYVRDYKLYKKEGNNTEYILHNPNLKVHSITFTGTRPRIGASTIHYEYTIGNVEANSPDHYLKVVRDFFHTDRMNNYLLEGRGEVAVFFSILW